MERKKAIIRYQGGREIEIPQPDDIRLEFRGGRRFDFHLQVEEPRLRNFAAILSRAKRRR